ncbi:MAG: tRNA pseudouridine(13) synthase TruD [Cocleimonas sp.]
MEQFLKVNANSQLSGLIRTQPEDFQVDEIQQFKASGIGEHVWLHIKKTGENTDWVARELAKVADVPRRDVSYAGMKDRNAVTTQWFSVQMPGRDAPDWQKKLPDSVQVLAEKRHDRKLRRGALVGNQFKLLIRDFNGEETELRDTIERIQSEGVPNYFGEQRFGYKASNISKAEQWFTEGYRIKDRNKRSIYLSAARSWIFNHILSERIKEGSWNQAVEGDVFMLDGTKSCFIETVGEIIKQRILRQDIHPTGALWGRGRLASQGSIFELENELRKQFLVLSDGLERQGLKQERRSLRLPVRNFGFEILHFDLLQLTFSLPAGTYATSVLAEIGRFSLSD